MCRYRERFEEPDIALELGFLFEAYTNEMWYFEICDMAHVSLVSCDPLLLLNVCSLRTETGDDLADQLLAARLANACW